MGGKKEKIEENTMGDSQIKQDTVPEMMTKIAPKIDLSGSEEMKRLCQTICEESFDARYKGLEIYVKVDDFKTLSTITRVMQVLREDNANDATYIDLHQELTIIISRKAELDTVAHQLEKMRITLTEEILNFTTIVQEMSNRYKLSPNWEGKKPVLIEKQKELEKRKSEYEKNEQQLDECLIAFYKEYTRFYNRLRENL